MTYDIGLAREHQLLPVLISLNPVSRLLREQKRQLLFTLAHISRKSVVKLGNYTFVMSQRAQYLSHSQVLLGSAEHVYVGFGLNII